MDDERFEGDLPPSAALAQGRAAREGAEFDDLALQHLIKAGANVLQRGGSFGGVPIDALIKGRNRKTFTVLAHGNVDRDGKRPGLRRTDTVRKAGDSAYLLQEIVHSPPLLIITSDVPVERGRSRQAARLLAMHSKVIFDVIALDDIAAFRRLRHYLTDKPAPEVPLDAPWRLLPTEQLGLSVWDRPDA
jgi:hypothetical protein